MINLDTVRAHVAAIGDLLDLPFAHPGAYERLDDAALREHVAVHLRAALEGDEVPTPPGAEKAVGLEGVLVDYLDALRDLTATEAKVMADAWSAARGAPWDAAWDAARDAGRVAERDAGWTAGRVATLDAVGVTGRAAARTAGRALVVADLVGLHDLTREHLDTLTGPARTIPRLAKIIDRALPTIPKEN